MNGCPSISLETDIESHPRVRKNEPMNRHTSFRIGGAAQYFALPESADECMEILSMAKQANLPVVIIGGGSNVLVPDAGIQGLVLCTKKMKSGIRFSKETQEIIQADAGETLACLVRFSGEKGLAGLEFAAGIPGTLGGAIMMNAGIQDRSMEDVVYSVTVVDLTSFSVRELKRQELAFSYRSLELGKAAVLGASLCLEQDESHAVTQRIREQAGRKKVSQPVQSASAGCFFKNPSSGPSAGYLIDQAGLRGMTYKQARVSDIHANYIINMGKASCSDVLELARMVEDKVFARYKIRLEPEIKVVNHE